MTFRRNIAVSYISQIYAAVVGVALIPVYIRILGLEGYGLVAFYSMMQTWFLLLDVGFSPTISQQVARYRGGALEGVRLWQLLRALELIFLGIGIVGVVLLVASSGFISSRWLQAQQLQEDKIRDAVVLMSLSAAFRWMTCLYRATVNGFERLAWLGIWTMLASTSRFLLVIPMLIIFDADTTVYFVYQLVISAVELMAVKWQAYKLMAGCRSTSGERSWSLKPIRDVLGFSLSIGFAGCVYIAVTQVDKLVLSRTLSLAVYGAFSVAVLLAGGVFTISGPIGSAIMPRMTRFHAEGKIAELTDLYRVATQLAIALAVPLASMLAIFPHEILWVWTGDDVLSDLAAPALSLYAIGYAVFVIAAFPYYLQFAYGNLRLHIIGNVILAAVFIPSLVYAGLNFGMIGTAWTWLVLNASYFLLWVPLVHQRFLPKAHLSWLGQDVVQMVSIIGAVALLTRQMVTWPSERWLGVVQLCAIGALLTFVAVLSGSRIRNVAASVVSFRWRAVTGRT